MKKFNQINQYLLEKYPTIWNTKLVWMLLLGFCIHLIFFVIGYISHISPKSLHYTNAVNDYYESGLIFVHLIISLLLLVAWLISMFKNNAFKNYYPTSKWNLFSQFAQYFIIILVCTTFYFSYMFGFKLFINQRYDDASMKQNIELINKTYPFLSQNPEYYTLDNRKYPEKFYDLYCEMSINKIDRSKSYFVFHDRVYQFYSLYSKTSVTKDKYGNFIIPEPELSEKKEVIYGEEKDKSKVFFFKKDVEDVSSYIKTTAYSYENFSEIFYVFQQNNLNYNDFGRYSTYPSIAGDDYKSEDDYKKEKFEINKSTTAVLNKKDSKQLEKQLADFLVLSKKYGIETNLESKSWTKLVYHPESFEVRKFIKKYVPAPNEEYDINYSGDYNYAYATAAVDSTAAAYDENGNEIVVEDTIQIEKFNPNIKNEISNEDFFKANLTDYYYYSDSLKNLLLNVDSVKSKEYVKDTIHIYLWIAFALSLLIFSFRIVGLKSLLFSIIAAGALSLFLTLISVFIGLGFGNNDFFVMYFIFFVGLLILLVPLLMLESTGKLISSIFITISMNGFVLWVLLIFAIITKHQTDDCRYLNEADRLGNIIKCEGLLDYLGAEGSSFVLLLIGFIFMYLYTSVLQKWKSLPQ